MCVAQGVSPGNENRPVTISPGGAACQRTARPKHAVPQGIAGDPETARTVTR